MKPALEDKYQNYSNLNQFEENFIKKLPPSTKGKQKIIQQVYLLMTFNFESEEDIKKLKREIFEQINKLDKYSKLYELFYKACFPNAENVSDDRFEYFMTFLRDEIVEKIKKEALIKFKEKSRIKEAYSKEGLGNIIKMYTKIFQKLYFDLKISQIKDEFSSFYNNFESLNCDAKDYVKKCDKLLKKLKDESYKKIRKIKSIIFKSKDKAEVSEDLKKLFKKSAKEIFNYYYIWYLNSKGESGIWKSSSQKFSVKSDDGKIKTKVNINVNPVSEILPSIKNIASMDRENENAINMWKNEVKSNDGKVLFSAIRHGNTRGKEESSKQILLAAAVQEYGLENLKKQPNKIWEVHLANVQLMTGATKIARKLGENELISSQMETFRKLSQKDKIDVNIDDKTTVHLKLIDPILFNFGVDKIYYNKMIPTDDMYSENLESLEKLFGKKLPSKESEKNFNKKSLSNISEDWFNEIGGSVGKYIKDKLLDKKIKENEINLIKIKNLSKQILYIWHTTNGHGIKNNPTSIQARLLALMNLIGYPVTFNCKSGKDRTGILAAEVNNLVTSMEANGGEVPDPYKKLSTDEKLNLVNALEASNSEEITKYNTGYRGLKIREKELKERFGKLTGTSKNAKV